MNFFTEGFEDLHNDVKQMIRQERSSEFEINWLPKLDDNGQLVLTPKGNVRKQYMINTRLQTARIGDYLVSLHGCTCGDFHGRRLPCKHMYKLAAKLGLFINKAERSLALIADFSNGYVEDWAFVVRPCNYESLDIRWSTMLIDGEKRGKQSKKKTVLTQGNLYNFTRGLFFYDCKAGYTDIWRDALQKLEIALQIDLSTTSSELPQVFWINGRYIRKNIPSYGRVNFSVYKPNNRRMQLDWFDSYSCRQDEFVSLLKTGSFFDINGEKITLKETNDEFCERMAREQMEERLDAEDFWEE